MGLMDWLKAPPRGRQKIPFEVHKERPPLSDVDAIYQTENCSDHTYYCATKRPRKNGNWCSLGREVRLAGTGSDKEYAKNMENFFFGDKRWIVFVHDAENPFSPHAVQVYGVWTNRGSRQIEKGKIGFVSKEDSEDVYEKIKVTKVIGTPSVLFYGKENIGLRFRVWFDMEPIENNLNNVLSIALSLLLRENGASIKEIFEKTNFEQVKLRNWLSKLEKGEIVSAYVMAAFSGYRIEKIREGKSVRYIAVLDGSKEYVKKTGMTEQQIDNDQMGANVPDYIFSA